MDRKKIITRSEFDKIESKLSELIKLVNNYEHLYTNKDDLLCLAVSLFFLKQGSLKDLKIVD